MCKIYVEDEFFSMSDDEVICMWCGEQVAKSAINHVFFESGMITAQSECCCPNGHVTLVISPVYCFVCDSVATIVVVGLPTCREHSSWFRSENLPYVVFDDGYLHCCP